MTERSRLCSTGRTSRVGSLSRMRCILIRAKLPESPTVRSSSSHREMAAGCAHFENTRISRSSSSICFLSEGLSTRTAAESMILPDSGDGRSFERGIECHLRPNESGDIYAFPGATLVGQVDGRRNWKGCSKLGRRVSPGSVEQGRHPLRRRFRINYELNGRDVNWPESSQPISDGSASLIEFGTSDFAISRSRS